MVPTSQGATRDLKAIQKPFKNLGPRPRAACSKPLRAPSATPPGSTNSFARHLPRYEAPNDYYARSIRKGQQTPQQVPKPRN